MRLNEADFGSEKHIGWRFVQVNEAVKHFSRSQVETVLTENLKLFPLGAARGGSTGRRRFVPGTHPFPW